MANEVYANGMEVSCKSGAGKSICAFPDVCFTPPLTPATPPGVPLPYPNTGMASDTSDGSKTVQITGKEVMLKDSSSFKQSTGDEAGSAPKKGVVTSKIKGKVYYTAWSMDVKFEGENAVRHLDIMTHNHASGPGNSPPWPFQDGQTQGTKECEGDQKKMKEKCDDKGITDDPHCPSPLHIKTETFKEQVRLHKGAAKDMNLKTPKQTGGSRSSIQAPAATDAANADECVKARRCRLVPFKEDDKKKRKKCCDGQTPHHVPPKACLLNAGFHAKGKGGKTGKYYDDDEALCVCLEGTSQHYGSHGKNHAAIDHLAEQQGLDAGDKVSIKEYNKICAKAVALQCGCDEACILAQLEYSLQPTERELEHVDTHSSADLDLTAQPGYKKAFDLPPAGST